MAGFNLKPHALPAGCSYASASGRRQFMRDMVLEGLTEEEGRRFLELEELISPWAKDNVGVSEKERREHHALRCKGMGGARR
jgi:hypothetical protein